MIRCYCSPNVIHCITRALTNSLRVSLVRYLQMRPMDLMALIAFLHVSVIWCVCKVFI